MRSMAAESSRELVRRLRRGETGTAAWDVWIDWHALDLAGEPSAFEPRILVSRLQDPQEPSLSFHIVNYAHDIKN